MIINIFSNLSFIYCMKDFQSIHQRRVLGILCLLLAPLSIAFGLFSQTNPEHWWYSISATYYANSNMLMIGLLFATSVFFITYRGYDITDRIITDFSALFAIGIVTFPCNIGIYERVGLFQLPVATSNIIHYCCAAGLFLSFALMIIFRFTKSNGPVTQEKKARNIVYYVCGGVILLFMIWQLITALIHLPGYWTIINETVMLTAFSIAWLVKGESFKRLNDKE